MTDRCVRVAKEREIYSRYGSIETEIWINYIYLEFGNYRNYDILYYDFLIKL